MPMYKFGNKTYNINLTESQQSHLDNLKFFYENWGKNPSIEAMRKIQSFDPKFLEDRMAETKSGTSYEDAVKSYLNLEQENDNLGYADTVKAQEEIKQRADIFADPNSKFYSAFRKGLTSTLAGANSPSSMLAMVMASGGSFAQAQEKIKALQAKINDAAISGTEQFYGDMQNSANQLYGTNLSSKQGMMQYFGNMNFQNKQLAQQQSQFEQSQPTFWDNLLNIGSTVGGYGLGKWLFK